MLEMIQDYDYDYKRLKRETIRLAMMEWSIEDMQDVRGLGRRKRRERPGSVAVFLR